MSHRDAPGIGRDIEKTRLDNGLQVVLHPDRRLPLVAVNLWYHVGSRNEVAGRTGFAHLFEHMLFQGSEHVGTNDHFAHLQRVGGVANGSTWYDRTNYYETVPSEWLDLALWLESDRLGFLLPALSQAKLDNQRDVVLNERRQRVDNQPYGRSFERLFELLFPPGHPYHWPVIGWEADIRAATLQDVRQFFSDWYGPNNVVLTLAGDFDPPRALDKIDHWFGDIPLRPTPARADLPLAPIGTAIHETTREGVQLPRIYWAFRTPPFGDDAWLAGQLLASHLSDGKSSPLYRNLVWEQQLAQDAGAYLYPTEATGIFLLWATARPGVDPQRLAASMRELIAEAASAVPDAELLRARKQSLSRLIFGLETLDARADRISMYTTFCDRPEGAFEESGRTQGLTPQDLADFADEHLCSARAVELTVAPEAEP